MYGLPQSTEIKKQLPKKAIYAKFNMPTSQREHFDADIARIDIEVGVSKATVPALAEGEEIKEFYVLGIQLKRKEYDPKNILMQTKLLTQIKTLECKMANEKQPRRKREYFEQIKKLKNLLTP